jgi:hypothetical protein
MFFVRRSKLLTSLIVEAELARFGKRDQTVLDRRIRDVWEIHEGRVNLGKGWGEQLDSILKEVQKNLGMLEGGKLTAQLHNMLIYMPGQFFKGHQDSEKADGMIGTLVVLLPSEFSGGELVVDQHGDQKTFRAPQDTSENRVALTYNLIFTMSPAAVPLKVNKHLEGELKAYFSTKDAGDAFSSHGLKRPRWFVYLFDHEYTQRSLSWQGLRGPDRDRAAELLSSADSLDLTAHLALADIHETWSTEYDERSWNQRGRWGGHHRAEEETEMEIESSEVNDHKVTELLDDEVELRHWVDRVGDPLDRRGCSIPRDEVCWTKAVDEFRPFRSEYEGYMGNYGNTLDRWYHRAAIVLWEKHAEYANLFISDFSEALKKINDLLRQDLAAGRAAVNQILPLWPKFMNEYSNAQKIFETARLVNNAETAAKLVGSFGIGVLSENSRSSFLMLAGTYGEDWCLGHLEVWGKRKDWEDRDSLSEDLIPLVRDLSRSYQKISSWILEYLIGGQITEDRSAEERLSKKEINGGLKDRVKLITSLFHSAQIADEFGIHRKLIEHVLKHPRSYPAVELVDVLEVLSGIEGSLLRSWGYGELLSHLRERLEVESSLNRAKDDWSIRESLRHDCPDCGYLQEFLASTIEQKIIWPLAKERRMHIHHVLDGMEAPVTHVTQHVGSPHKLVLTKTQELFALDKARSQDATKALLKLRKLASSDLMST